jgi:hypothetical protein
VAARRRAPATARADETATTTAATPPVWKPWVVAAWCFVFPPAGAVLYYLNMRSIAQPGRGLVAIVATSLGTIAVIALPIVFRVGIPPNTVALLNVVSMAVLYFDWKAQLDTPVGRRAREASWSTSFVWALPICIAGYGAIALFVRLASG